MAEQIAIAFEPPRAGRNFQEIISKWSDAELQKNLPVYERLVEVHSGKALPRLNPITKKLIQPDPMPWMLPAYESGLVLIKQEIQRRQEIKNAIKQNH